MTGMNGYNGEYDPRKSWNGQPAPADSSGKKPDPRETIYRLINLQQDFNRTASDYQRMAAAVGDALTLLEDAQKQKDEAVLQKLQAQLENRAAQATGVLAGSDKKGEFIMLVDGSGSMNGAYIFAAMDAATVVQKATGGASKLALFGDRKPVWITQNISDPVVRHKLNQTLNSGTDLAPSVSEVERDAALNTLAKKSTHFIVVSDGDVFDAEKSKDALRQMLLSNKKATVDFVIMARPGTSMERMAQDIEGQFPGRVRKHIVDTRNMVGPDTYFTNPGGVGAHYLSTAVQDTVMQVLVDRLKKPAAPKKKAAPQP